MPQAHKTSLICLKTAHVDLKILPVVKWLNSFHSVFTLYSCQGHVMHKSAHSSAYTLFLCSDPSDLYSIETTLSNFHLNNNEYLEFLRSYESASNISCTRFSLRMHPNTLPRFSTFLKENHPTLQKAIK